MSRGDEVETDGGVQQPAEGYNVQPVATQRSLTKSEKRRYRRQYGILRTFFKGRSRKHTELQRAINQARMGVMVDEYLARSAIYAGAATLFGIVLGVLLTYLLSLAGVFETITAPDNLQGAFTQLLANNRLVFGGLGVTLLSAVFLGGGVWLTMLYYPRTVVSSRRQNLTVTLPHAIVYMYALAYGGMDLTEVLRSLSQADDAYGEVSREFDMVIRDIDLFGSDLMTALGNMRNLTPSDTMEQFTDDMISVLDTGGDMVTFLESEARTYLEEAKDEQEDFLETLSIMSEVFIVSFVAAPLFLIVILVVISLLGGQTLTQITLLTYAVIPVGMMAFVILIDVLSSPFVQVRADLDEPERGEPVEPTDELESENRYNRYVSRLRRQELLAFFRDPLSFIRDEPLYTLAFTVPVALVVMIAAVLLDVVTLTLDAFLANSFLTTVVMVVIPFLIVAVPLAYFYEVRRARENTLSRRFPDTLNILASANQMGIALPDGLDLVARTSSGVLSDEITIVRNDIIWNDDVHGAMRSFGYRLRVPQLARTTRLIAEGISSTGDLSRVLSIAAEDARNRWRIERKRRRELSSYIAIVVIGFLVYLLVILMLDTSYLTPIQELAAEQEAQGRELRSGIGNLGSVPIDVYRAVFFHSALIQAVGSGLLAGKLSDNSIQSGLKYAIGLVVVSVLAFAFI